MSGKVYTKAKTKAVNGERLGLPPSACAASSPRRVLPAALGVRCRCCTPPDSKPRVPASPCRRPTPPRPVPSSGAKADADAFGLVKRNIILSKADADSRSYPGGFGKARDAAGAWGSWAGLLKEAGPGPANRPGFQPCLMAALRLSSLLAHHAMPACCTSLQAEGKAVSIGTGEDQVRGITKAEADTLTIGSEHPFCCCQGAGWE